ncbi:hypothetical protein AB0F77_35365 [Streptomyces sp. NPDC026672]|uniref:hypothetical protein n=1 Tax=unclassified Streptomyces TaxID=2593676 RepID=UPI0033E9263F
MHPPTPTPAATARLLVSWTARTLSDQARALVPRTGHDSAAPPGPAPGAVLADAADVFDTARHLLETAVVYERIRGTAWPSIAPSVRLSPQHAAEAYTDAVARFRLVHTAFDPEAAQQLRGEAWWRVFPVHHPAEAAADLHDWLHRSPDHHRHQ